MAAHLSRLAKYHIADFVNHREVIMLPREWHEMYEIYHSGGIQRHRMPLPEYAMTKEFDLCLRKDVSPAAVEYLFTEGPEATFWYKVPTGLVSTIVELFLQRPTETPLRPVLCVCDFSTPSATLLWQELYVSFFPCGHCERIQVGGDEEVGRRRPWNFHDPTISEHIRRHNGIGWDEAMEAHVKHTPTYVIEVFHVKSPASGQEMTIELWFDSFGQSVLERFAPFPTDARVQKHLLRRVKIQIAACRNLPLAPLRLSPLTPRSHLLGELMLEAYRFLPRYWLDASQLVCDDWRHSIDRAAEHLPLYPLTVDFKHTDVARERERMGSTHYGVRLDHEWEANVTNYSDCFAYVNCRDFRFINAQSPEHSSEVIRRHLRNAFVKRMSCNVMTTDLEWSVRMLQGLGSNTVIDELDTLMMREECFDLMERFDDGVRRCKLQKLHLTVLDSLLKALVVDRNFFGQPSIRHLEELQLGIQHFDAPLEPYWIPALYELSNCRHLKISYEFERRGQHSVDASRIVHALSDVLKELEETGRDIAVEHFALASRRRLPSFEGGRKPAHESVRVPKLSLFDGYPWDVHYYETADRKKCLTLFVRKDGDGRRGGSGTTEVHVKRGKISDFGDAADDDANLFL